MLCLSLCITQCKKKSDDDDTPAATCSDGIQNQGETGVDCGGPCAACPVICAGNGSNSYFPMAMNNVWKYATSGTTVDYELKITGTQVYSGKTYNVFTWDDYFSSNMYYYYRADSVGNIYSYVGSSEKLWVPANPTVGQGWVIGGDSMKVVSLNATATTQLCTYTDLLQIDRKDNSTGGVVLRYYYKKGIGMVRRWYFVDENLVQVTLN
jgi:hypothetical protein